ncbi:MAG TPA: aspartyl protease family protein [Parafilimonas sp.]|nr:aspartyl protease family protein [Parafilimonas sp.]
MSQLKISRLYLFLLLFSLTNVKATAQNTFIYTSDDRPVMRRKELITTCLESFHADRNDTAALAICECQLDNLNRRFSYKQYKKYNHGGLIDIQALLDEDTVVKKAVQNCFTNSNRTMLIQAQGFENDFMDSCFQNIRRNTNKNLDDGNVRNFCSCQLNLIKTKKLSDAKLRELDNPNSLLFYEVMYACGDPFREKGEVTSDWTKDAKNDITGPEVDTVSIITINGLSYVEIKMGSLVQYWLFDTGASDLLINNDMEKTLLQEGVLTQQNYLGTGEYEMANGIVDTCRKYMVKNTSIGKYIVDNVVVAVTDKGKRIIVGRSLLNKFNNWKLDNEKNLLILNK